MSTEEIPTLVPVEELAARSAAFLDEVRPGWAVNINLDDFDMQSGHTCVIAQVYEDWGNRYEIAALLDPENVDLIRKHNSYDDEAADQAYLHVRQIMIDHGFLLPLRNGEVDGDGYERLSLAWEAEIRRRRS